MKFCRFGAPGLERPGLVDPTGVLRDLSAVVGDIDPDTLPTLRSRVPADLSSLPVVQGQPRYGSPVARPARSFRWG